MESFLDASSHLPDVQPDTLIIGLCGVSDYFNPDLNTHACDPREDGWMLSDFYLLNYLFSGLGRSQAWFTCLNPADLVARYGEYAHGNQYGTRKVVLDCNKMPDRTTLHITDADTLLPTFLEHLRRTCAEAVKSNKPVLLCVFCHGEDETFGWHIGGLGKDGPVLHVKTVAEILAENEGVQLCLLLTSCFSGGWAITPQLQDLEGKRKAIVMAGAGPETESESWPQTHSLGRTCGSFYISSLLNVLSSEEPTEHTSPKAVSMNTEEFASAIKHQLCYVIDPRFGDNHEIQFTVQNDQWTDLYHARTGIPLSTYRTRLQELRSIPARDLPDFRKDRTKTAQEIDDWEARHPESGLAIMAASNFGGSMRAVKKATRTRRLRIWRAYQVAIASQRILDLMGSSMHASKTQLAWPRICGLGFGKY